MARGRKPKEAKGAAPPKAAPPARSTAQRLDSIVKSARNALRKDKGLDGDTDRLPLLAWLMFLKLLDDAERVREAEARMEGRPFRPVVEPPYRWRDWAGPKGGLTGDDLLRFLTAEAGALRPDGTTGPGLFATLRGLRAEEGAGRDRRAVVATVFEGVVLKVRSGHILRDVVDLLGGIHFDASDEVFQLSRLYEGMLRQLRDAAGAAGEYYTPRPVVRFMVRALDPRLGEVVEDPACGTAGFLVEAFAHLKAQRQSAEDERRLQEGSLRGGEAKPLPFLLGQMNLLLHGLDAPDIDPGNALRHRLAEIGEAQRVDVVLTNPPFGGEEEAGVLDNFPADRRTAETALLFLQLIARKLRRGGRGRAAVVVPNGTLFEGGVAARIKADLLEGCDLHAVVRLPEGVFAPYTDIPANILFFRTGGPTREVAFWEQPLPEGRRKYTKTQPMLDAELDDALAWYRAGCPEGERSWRVPAEGLVRRDATGRVVACNLDLKNPRAAAKEDHRTPAEILAAAIGKEREALRHLEEMRALLGLVA
ncbi:MAG: type I restriction-modification system subunit M [Acetobacteraceae bacterium]|nr:type I restriction-modification system subunit M [Acetobacteraceae bacterium]